MVVQAGRQKAVAESREATDHRRRRRRRRICRRAAMVATVAWWTHRVIDIVQRGKKFQSERRAGRERSDILGGWVSQAGDVWRASEAWGLPVFAGRRVPHDARWSVV